MNNSINNILILITFLGISHFCTAQTHFVGVKAGVVDLYGFREYIGPNLELNYEIQPFEDQKILKGLRFQLNLGMAWYNDFPNEWQPSFYARELVPVEIEKQIMNMHANQLFGFVWKSYDTNYAQLMAEYYFKIKRWEFGIFLGTMVQRVHYSSFFLSSWSWDTSGQVTSFDPSFTINNDVTLGRTFGLMVKRQLKPGLFWEVDYKFTTGPLEYDFAGLPEYFSLRLGIVKQLKFNQEY